MSHLALYRKGSVPVSMYKISTGVDYLKPRIVLRIKMANDVNFHQVGFTKAAVGYGTVIHQSSVRLLHRDQAFGMPGLVSPWTLLRKGFLVSGIRWLYG